LGVASPGVEATSLGHTIGMAVYDRPNPMPTFERWKAERGLSDARLDERAWKVPKP